MNQPVSVNFDPAALAAKIRGLGRELDVEVLAASQQLYAALQAQVPYDGMTEFDVRYGLDPRHRLDLFLPKAKPAGSVPVVVFVHGGGFVRGDTRIPGMPYHENVGRWAVNSGFIGVNMTYRLAPDHLWPAGVEDVASVVNWVQDNIARHGGDPERIFLHGHSAGAVHVASYVGHGQFHRNGKLGIAGAVLGSGIYNLVTTEGRELVHRYFGAEKLAERSAFPGLLAAKIPLMLYVSERDPIDFEKQFVELTGALLRRDGHLPRIVRCYGHNHYTGIFNINLGTGDAISPNVLELIHVDAAQN